MNQITRCQVSQEHFSCDFLWANWTKVPIALQLSSCCPHASDCCVSLSRVNELWVCLTTTVTSNVAVVMTTGADNIVYPAWRNSHMTKCTCCYKGSRAGGVDNSSCLNTNSRQVINKLYSKQLKWKHKNTIKHTLLSDTFCRHERKLEIGNNQVCLIKVSFTCYYLLRSRILPVHKVLH